MPWVCEALQKAKGVPALLGVFPSLDSPRGEKTSAALSPHPSQQDGSVDADLKGRRCYAAGSRNKGTKRSATSGCGIDHRQEGSVCQTTPDKAKD